MTNDGRVFTCDSDSSVNMIDVGMYIKNNDFEQGLVKEPRLGCVLGLLLHDLHLLR